MRNLIARIVFGPPDGKLLLPSFWWRKTTGEPGGCVGHYVARWLTNYVLRFVLLEGFHLFGSEKLELDIRPNE